MELAEFKNFLKSNSDADIAEFYLSQKNIHALLSEEEYDEYKNLIRGDHERAHQVCVVGSANWKFSLNPNKSFRVFGRHSDIDVAVICAESFLQAWDELRRFHREQYYSLDQAARMALRRSGENVYSGFVTPKWIPGLSSPLKRDYMKLTEKYSTASVGYRSVNMMYFRNVAETIDYYVRGIRAAKQVG